MRVKAIVVGMGMAALAISAYAENYNRVSVGYQAMFLGRSTSYDTNLTLLADELGASVSELEKSLEYNFNIFNQRNPIPSDLPTLSGFTIDYRHGFQLSNRPMFVEAGLGLSYGTGSKTFMDYKYSISSFNIKIPVNFVYRFTINSEFSIQPYTGINFKFNGTMSYKAGKNSYNLFNTIENDFGIADDVKDVMTYSGGGRRVQMGWQIGIGVNWNKWYAGMEYGIDFMPAFKNEVNLEEDGWYFSYITKINSQHFSINVGYSF